MFHKTTAPLVAAVASHCSTQIQLNRHVKSCNLKSVKKFTINWIPRGIIARKI
jgi:hypothetical protein